MATYYWKIFWWNFLVKISGNQIPVIHIRLKIFDSKSATKNSVRNSIGTHVGNFLIQSYFFPQNSVWDQFDNRVSDSTTTVKYSESESFKLSESTLFIQKCPREKRFQNREWLAETILFRFNCEINGQDGFEKSFFSNITFLGLLFF